MATLGNTTITNTFTVGGSFGDAAGGYWVVPSPGIFVNSINVYAANNGSTSTDRLYAWEDNGSGKPGHWLLRGSGTFSMGSSFAWQTQTSLSVNTLYLNSSGFIPGGTKLWIGIYASTGILAYKGETSSTTELGNTADGDWSDHGPASGFGALGAYVDYTLAGVARVNTGTAGAPNWVSGAVYVNTGTPASPVWTAASGVAVNTGTPASPAWTQGV